MPVRLVALLLLSVIAAAAEDWPRFRGVNGSGVSSSTGLPVEFSAGRNQIFKTAAPFSRSSPVVAGGRVFLTAFENGKLITLCLDASTGKVNWRREIERPVKKAPHKANDPASPTPATDGQNVYVFFPDLGLISYDRQGTERWRVPLGPFDTFYGLASSPVVFGSTVLLNCDARSNAFLLAVDSSTGKTRWRVERKEIHHEGYTTPLLYKPKDEAEQIIIWSAQRVEGYQAATGERLWWFSGLSTYPIASPLVSGGLLLGSSFGTDTPPPSFDELLQKMDKDKDGKLSAAEVKGTEFDDFGSLDTNNDGLLDRQEWNAMVDVSRNATYGLVAVKLGGRGDLTKSALAWQEKKMWPSLASALLYQDVVYFTKGGGIIASMDPTNGKTLKAGRAKEAIEEHWASPVAADGKIYLASASGKVNVLKAGAQWEVLAVNNLDEEVFATPAIANDRLYIRTRGSLYCFGAK